MAVFEFALIDVFTKMLRIMYKMENVILATGITRISLMKTSKEIPNDNLQYMKSSTLTDHRNREIYKMYSELWKSGLREELIWPQLKEKFFIAESTLYRIVLKHIKEGNDCEKNIS